MPSTTTDLVRVDQLAGDETITGTAASGPSGPYAAGPRTLARVSEIPPANPLRPEYRLFWVGGGSQVYYGSTLVQVAR